MGNAITLTRRDTTRRGRITIAAVAVAVAIGGAVAAPTAASQRRAIAVVRINKGGHPTLGVLQHDTVVV